MTPEIKSLAEIWNRGPARVEPDNEEHLRYVFGELLPALNLAIPQIVNIAAMTLGGPTSQSPVAPPAAGGPSPSSATPSAPSTEQSTHILTEILRTADTVEGFDHTAGTVGNIAPSAAILAAPVAGEKPSLEIVQPASKLPKRASAKKRATAPRATPPGTPESVKA